MMMHQGERWQGVPMGDRSDHIAGALLGVHVGDSLGATTEFSDRAFARTLLPDTVEATDIVGGGTFEWRAGAATDDTDLTVALVRAYLQTDFGTSADLAKAAADEMLAWMRRDPRDIGGATRDGLSAYATSGNPHTSGGTNERSQGNGSLMRTVPVALARLDDPELRATEASTLSGITHGHQHCRDACIVYCDLIADLITHQSTDVNSNPPANPQQPQGPDFGTHLVRARTEDTRLAPAVRQALAVGLDTPLETIEGVNGDAAGWVLTALKIAVAALIDHRPAAEVLLDVVRLGGDADTNGAIAGGILGARDGLDAWPARWTDVLEYREELLAGASTFSAR